MQQQQDDDWLAYFAASLGYDLGETVSHTKLELMREDALSQDERARRTLAALAALARATSGYDGRKNLLWLSASFPLRLGAGLSLGGPKPIRGAPASRSTSRGPCRRA